MSDLIENEAITRCRQLGILDEIACRNLEINKKFIRMVNSGSKSVKAIESLMYEYKLGWNSVNEIVYGKYWKRKKMRDERNKKPELSPAK